MRLVFHVFIAVAVMVYLVAVMVCGHHGIGPMTTLMNYAIISASAFTCHNWWTLWLVLLTQQSTLYLNSTRL